MAKIFLSKDAKCRIAENATAHLLPGETGTPSDHESGVAMYDDIVTAFDLKYAEIYQELDSREGEVIPDTIVAQGGFPSVGMIKLSCGLVFQVNAQDFLLDLNAKGIEKPVSGLIMPVKGNV